MIKNTAPAAPVITSAISGYSLVYLEHSLGSDLDIQGRSIWVDDTYHATVDTDSPYTLVQGLSSATQYDIALGRHDTMSNTALIEAGFGINKSGNTTVSTRSQLVITAHSITGEYVEIGASPPVLNLTTTGTCDSLEVEFQENGTGAWLPIWSGAYSPDVAVPGVPVGTHNIRVRGVVSFPVFPHTEKSNWAVLNGVAFVNTFVPPSAPSTIQLEFTKLNEPAERYDARVSWDWVRGTGPQIKHFVLERLNVDRYGAGAWGDAEVINTGTAASYVVINHEFDRTFSYRVTAVSWGPDDSNSTTSAVETVTLTGSTPLTDFTRDTNLELTYAHLKAYVVDGGTKYQSFLLDAATGSIAIGRLDGGSAPITVDAVNGNVSVNGAVITDTIAAANFILADTTGSDNPKFHSASKTTFADASEGIYMGHNDSNKFRFDLGNNSKYIRWDGDNLRISGNVLIGTSGSTVDSAFNRSTTVYVHVPGYVDIPNSSAEVTQDYTNATGLSPALSSVIIYTTSDGSKHFQFTGSIWVPFSAVVDGDLLVSGTIAGNKIVAGSISGTEISSTTSIVAGVGATSATLSGDDASYRIWAGADLAANAPFRVTKEGSLELNSGATSSSMIIKNNVIQVVDASGALRVQIGDLSVPAP